MIMTKYEQTKKYDVAGNVEMFGSQGIFSIEGVEESGIFALTEKRYSKTYVLSDINFAGVTDGEQKEIIIGFSKVLKGIPCRFSYTVANEYVDEKKFYENILYRNRGDEDDDLRNSYNTVIREKLSDARQGLYQTIYLTLTIMADDVKDAKAQFLSIEGAIRSSFIGLGMNGMQGSTMHPLSVDERLQILFNFTHAGIAKGYPLSYKNIVENRQDFLNLLAPAAITYDNEEFRINNCFGKVMYIADYPKALESDILTSLAKVNCTSYVTVNNELLDIGGFKQEISRKYMKVGMKIENEKQRNRNNNDYLADASQKLLGEKDKLDTFLKKLDEQDDHYYNTTIMVLFMANTKEELGRIEEKLRNIASLKSLNLKSCFSMQREGINSALILGCQEFKRVVNLSSSCLAMFMPFKTQELNDENGVYYGINQLSQNAIFGDKKKLKNRNSMILGKSGSGKSVFSKSEILSVYLNNPKDQIIIVDPQGEYNQIVNRLRENAAVVCFDAKKEVYINPLDVDFYGVDYTDLREIISDKTDFILTLISSLLRRNVEAEEQGVIDRVVERVYSENFSMRKRLNGETEREREFEVPGFMVTEQAVISTGERLSRKEQVRAYSPTFQDIYQGLVDEGTELADHLAAAMDIFVNGSLNLFNHRTNVDIGKRLISFSFPGLKENLRVTSMLIMMEVLRSKLSENSKEGKWTHLYIDEFHELLGIDQIAAFVVKLWKEIRKLLGCACGISQNMSDLLNEENAGRLSAILSNTECFALLAQSSIDKRKLMEFLPNISPAMFNYVDNAESGTGLLKMGNVVIPFDIRMSKESEIYEIVNTDGGGYAV